MGGCATKPKDMATDSLPSQNSLSPDLKNKDIQVEGVVAPPAESNIEASEDQKEEVKETKEEPLVDLSEPNSEVVSTPVESAPVAIEAAEPPKVETSDVVSDNTEKTPEALSVPETDTAEDTKVDLLDSQKVDSVEAIAVEKEAAPAAVAEAPVTVDTAKSDVTVEDKPLNSETLETKDLSPAPAGDKEVLASLVVSA